MRDPVKGGDSGIDQDNDKTQSTQRPKADEMIQRFHATDDLADMQSSLMRDGAVIIEKVADSELITTITTTCVPRLMLRATNSPMISMVILLAAWAACFDIPLPPRNCSSIP